MKFDLFFWFGKCAFKADGCHLRCDEIDAVDMVTSPIGIFFDLDWAQSLVKIKSCLRCTVFLNYWIAPKRLATTLYLLSTQYIDWSCIFVNCFCHLTLYIRAAYWSVWFCFKIVCSKKNVFNDFLFEPFCWRVFYLWASQTPGRILHIANVWQTRDGTVFFYSG